MSVSVKRCLFINSVGKTIDFLLLYPNERSPALWTNSLEQALENEAILSQIPNLNGFSRFRILNVFPIFLPTGRLTLAILISIITNWAFTLFSQDIETRNSKRGHVLGELLETERIYVAEMGSILKVSTIKNLKLLIWLHLLNHRCAILMHIDWSAMLDCCIDWHFDQCKALIQLFDLLGQSITIYWAHEYHIPDIR